MQQHTNHKINDTFPCLEGNDRDEIRKLRNQLHQCQYTIRTQRDQLDGYIELIEEHTFTKKALVDALTEVEHLRDLLEQERGENDMRRESSSPLGKTVVVAKSASDDAIDISSELSSLASTPYSCCSSLDPEHKTEHKTEAMKHSQLLNEFLEVKLELARFRGEADWKDLEMNRLKQEHEVLLDQITEIKRLSMKKSSSLTAISSNIVTTEEIKIRHDLKPRPEVDDDDDDRLNKRSSSTSSRSQRYNNMFRSMSNRIVLIRDQLPNKTPIMFTRDFRHDKKMMYF